MRKKVRSFLKKKMSKVEAINFYLFPAECLILWFLKVVDVADAHAIAIASGTTMDTVTKTFIPELKKLGLVKTDGRLKKPLYMLTSRGVLKADDPFSVFELEAKFRRVKAFTGDPTKNSEHRELLALTVAYIFRGFGKFDYFDSGGRWKFVNIYNEALYKKRVFSEKRRQQESLGKKYSGYTLNRAKENLGETFKDIPIPDFVLRDWTDRDHPHPDVIFEVETGTNEIEDFVRKFKRYNKKETLITGALDSGFILYFVTPAGEKGIRVKEKIMNAYSRFLQQEQPREVIMFKVFTLEELIEDSKIKAEENAEWRKEMIKKKIEEKIEEKKMIKEAKEKGEIFW